MIIESHQEHTLALAMVEELMEFDPEGSSATEEAFLLALVKAVEAYELIHFPIPEPTAEEAAAFRADQERARVALGRLTGRVSDAAERVCRVYGHVPVKKMSATICDRCGEGLRGK